MRGLLLSLLLCTLLLPSLALGNQPLQMEPAGGELPKIDIVSSDDQGATWVNLFDCYVGRTIIEAPDGSLLASLWPYPADEGLYRSTDNGDTWGGPLALDRSSQPDCQRAARVSSKPTINAAAHVGSGLPSISSAGVPVSSAPSVSAIAPIA